MAYLHCHTPNCHWSQDDFWDEDGYTPFNESKINYLKKSLLQDRIYLDKIWFEENGILPYYDDKGYFMKGTEFVALELKKMSSKIINMSVKTYDEWKYVKNTWKCPRCGLSNPDID